MTTRRLLRPTQTRHDHSDQRQRDDENVDEMSQSESPISTGLYFLELGPFDFFVLQLISEYQAPLCSDLFKA